MAAAGLEAVERHALGMLARLPGTRVALTFGVRAVPRGRRLALGQGKGRGTIIDPGRPGQRPVVVELDLPVRASGNGRRKRGRQLGWRHVIRAGRSNRDGSAGAL